MAQVDLNTCDREPIHIPAAIQPQGALLALERRGDGFVIGQASANVDAMLGIDAPSLAGLTLDSVLRADDARLVEEAFGGTRIHATPVYLGRVAGRRVATQFDAVAHAHDGWLVLEVEPVDAAAGAAWSDERGDLYRHVQAAIADLRAAPSVDALCDQLAIHVRQIAGFDRVMVYRFDEQWNGHVISERRRDDLEPFLGLHYPAADIPRQARELYTRNWLRFIADRDYTPVPMVPPADPRTGRPLDMSHSVLRSVSPIHLEYLRNMGVGASMSISLLNDGALWGLVACHHYAPRRVPYVLRNASETLGQIVSLQIAVRERKDLERDIAAKDELIRRLVDAAEAGDGMAASLVQREPNVLALVDCSGAAVVIDDHVARIGQTPSERDIVEIADFVCRHGESVFAADAFPTLANKPQLTAVASGVLAATFAREGRRAILWFRPEQVRTVNWAGDPSKSVAKGDGAVRLSPRGSFALWKGTVSGRSVNWSTTDRAAATKLRAGVFGKLLVHASDVSRHNDMLRRVHHEREQLLESERAARSQAEKLNRMKDDFVATLSHELRTPLTAIQGWAQLLRSRPREPEKYAEGLAVIERNARIQSQMVSDLLDMSRITSGKMRLDVQSVELPAIVSAAVESVRFAAEAKDITIRKALDPLPGITVSGDPTRLQQITWNLLTNAIKFTPRGGRIMIELRRAGSYVELGVRDNGMGIPADFLPHVFDRFRQADASTNRKHGGLGLGLAIVRHLVEMHGGTIFAESPGEGAGSTFTVTLPIRALSGKDSEPHPSVEVYADECHGLNLRGVRALVVDDEADARELVANVLRDCGVEATIATSVPDVLAHAAAGRFDVLISDIGMPELDGYSLIRQLRQDEAAADRPRLPAIALTAYARAADRRQIMLAGFQVHVAKPVEPTELLAVVASLSNRI